MTRGHAIALVLIPLLSVGGAVVATWSARVRDVLFFLMVSLAVLAERMDVNFFSAAWYRGTTRGVQITLLEIMALALLIGCWLGRRGEERRWFWPASLGALLLYTVYAGLSIVVSEPRLFGVFELSKMVGGLVVFLAAAMYLRTVREWTVLVIALGCAVGFEGIWAVKQRWLDHLERVAGTLDHANSLSMYFCLAIPLLVAVALSGWSRLLRGFCAVAVVLGTVGLVLTVSRAGLPILAVVVTGTILACASWRLTVGRLVVRATLVVGLAVLVMGSWPTIAKRYAGATLNQEYFDPTIDGRGVYLRLAGMIATDRFFGVGLNNWSYHVSRSYGPRLGFRFVDYDNLIAVYGTEDDKIFGDAYLAAPAHNLAALTLGELGVPGLVLFALLWLRWFWMGAVFLPLPRADPMRVMGVGLFFCVCGIFGQSLTEWVYRQTPIYFTFYIFLGALASLTSIRCQRRKEARLLASPQGLKPTVALETVDIETI